MQTPLTARLLCQGMYHPASFKPTHFIVYFPFPFLKQKKFHQKKSFCAWGKKLQLQVSFSSPHLVYYTKFFFTCFCRSTLSTFFLLNDQEIKVYYQLLRLSESFAMFLTTQQAWTRLIEADYLDLRKINIAFHGPKSAWFDSI